MGASLLTPAKSLYFNSFKSCHPVCNWTIPLGLIQRLKINTALNERQ